MSMNILTPVETLAAYSAAGVRKAALQSWRIVLLAILAGALIALAGAATNTAAHSAAEVGTVRLICGLIFPFGLGLVVLTGAELFTGNTLMVLSLADRKITPAALLKNWVLVYLGNFAGSVAVAAGCAFTGQLNYSAGGLALFTMKLAAGKCTLPFVNALVLGLLCNLLVCLGVLGAMTAKDTTGKILGSYLPVALFVLCGFEHSVANMFYIPAGLFAKGIPAYAQLATQAGLDLAPLTWGNFLAVNLLPVTLGNILGGSGVGLLLWLGHKQGTPTT